MLIFETFCFENFTKMHNTIRLNFNVVSVATANGEICKFPFKYEVDGPEYYICTDVGTNRGTWCATTVKDDLTYDAWDWC